MPERTLYRVGGGAAMLGAVIGLVFNLLHPRSTEALDSVEAELQLITDNGIWLFDHFMLGWSIMLALIALLAIGTSFPGGSSASFARLARGAAVAGATVGFAVVAVDGMAMNEIAENWAEASGPLKEAALASGEAVGNISGALFTVLIGVFFGLTPLLYGLAILETDTYPSWMGWTSLVVGVGGLGTASIQYLTGLSTATAAVMFPAVSLVFTVLLALIGWRLWKMAEAPTAAVATPAPATPAP